MHYLKSFLFTLLIFTQASWANDASYAFNGKVAVKMQGEDIYLVGSDCRTLEKESGALMEWTKKVKEKGQSSKCSCENGQCLQKVNAQLPEFARNKQFKKSVKDGPNCWNATLVAAKIVPQVRYTSNEEMQFWMSSPLCREKGLHEPLTPGDVIAIRNEAMGESHGFIHISDNLSFSKNGYDSRMAYSLQDPNFVFELYEVEPECRRKVGEPEECGTWANYYSCQSMDDYLKKHPIKDDSLKEVFKAVNDIECKLSDMAFSGSMQTLTDFQLKSLAIIKFLAKDKLEKKDHRSEEKIIWEGIYFKTDALIQQLKIL